MKNKILLFLAKVARFVSFTAFVVGGLIILIVFGATLYHLELVNGSVQVEDYYREGLMLFMCIGGLITTIGAVPVLKIEATITGLRKKLALPIKE